MANTEATIIEQYKTALNKQGKTGRRKGKGVAPSILERAQEAAKSEAILRTVWGNSETKDKKK